MCKMKADKLASFLKRNTGLFLIGENVYGAGGEHFLRMNIACPKSVCLDGLNRLKNGIKAFEQEKKKMNSCKEDGTK